MKLKILIRLFALTLALFFIFSCKSTEKKETGPIESFTLEYNEASSKLPSTDIKALTFKVDPVAINNLDNHSNVYRKDIKFQYEVRGFFSGMLEQVGDWGLPVPCFRIKITNTANNVIKLLNSIIILEDNNGNTYELIVSKSDLSKQGNTYINDNSSGIEKKAPAGSQVIGVNYEEIFDNLKILNTDLTILPQKEVTVYAFFYINLNKYKTPESKFVDVYNKFMSGKEYFKLNLYDIVSETDAAGNVKTKSSYELYFDVKKIQL
ncbi:MAG: hypothetical protein KA885_04440 [Spirochaetes bacterium]|nr:hypothetical protein [Spirochaetota bacterium]